MEKFFSDVEAGGAREQRQQMWESPRHKRTQHTAQISSEERVGLSSVSSGVWGRVSDEGFLGQGKCPGLC